MEDFYEPETETDEDCEPPHEWVWEVLNAMDRSMGARCWWLADYSALGRESKSEAREAIQWAASMKFLSVVSLPAIGDHDSGFGTLDAIVLHVRPNPDLPVEDRPVGPDVLARVIEERERLRYRIEAEKLARRKRRRDAEGQRFLTMGDDIGIELF